MKIVWDEPKRLANIARHGMDFVDLDEAFFEGSVIVPAKLGRRPPPQRDNPRGVRCARNRRPQRHQHATGEWKGTEIDQWVSSRSHSSRAAAIPRRIGTTFK